MDVCRRHRTTEGGQSFIAVALIVAAAASLGSAAIAMTPGQAMAKAHAALEALQSGDNKTAIRLFNEAIGSQELASQYLELAYVKRGEAFLNNNEPDHARRDTDAALDLNPSDREARTLYDQTTAQAQPGSDDAQRPMPLRYMCGQNHQILLEFNSDRTLVRFALEERGRKLAVTSSGQLLQWRFHVLHVNGDPDAMYYGTLSFDQSTNVVRIDGHHSDGRSNQGFWNCIPDAGSQ
jgi:tetratricopeptide (TPR) repeat protein